jgi:hypothetical protein
VGYKIYTVKFTVYLGLILLLAVVLLPAVVKADG